MSNNARDANFSRAIMRDRPPFHDPLPGLSLTIREWLATKSAQQNHDFGGLALHYVAEGKW
jgi:hypothetical protein